MGKKENIRLLKEATDRLIKLYKTTLTITNLTVWGKVLVITLTNSKEISIRKETI